MKTKFLSMVLFSSMLFSASQAVAQHHEFANYKRYAQDNTRLGKPAKDEKRVVFMGNSITEGWVNQHPDFFKKHGYIGRGISGQTSFQFLLRFREDVIKLQPKVVVLNYGTNDIAENTGAYNEELTYGNIISMVEMARFHKIKVILASCLPARNFGWRPNITDGMQKIRSLNARVKAYAKANNIPYVDYFTALLAKDGNGMDSKYTPETVHPNLAGYAVMEKLIVPVVEKLR